MPPDSLYYVRVKACQAKGYIPSCLEEALESEKSDGPSFVEDHQSNEVSNTSDEVRQLDTLADVLRFREAQKIMPYSAEKGVVTHRFGPFDVYVVYREVDSGRGDESGSLPDRTRYRVYIPAMSLVSIGGFNVWTSAANTEGRICIRNEFHVGGKSSQYLHRQWYPNLALFCPLMTGPVPGTDNTTVELSYKIKKHNTDLGVQAMQRSGGMKVQEYVKRSAQACGPEAVRIIGILSALYRKAQVPGKSRPTGRKRKKRVSEICEKTNPLRENSQIISGVFSPKRRKVHAPLASPHSKKSILLDITDRVQELPETQLSQEHSALLQESWRKNRPGKRKTGEQKRQEMDQFVELLRNVKDNFLRSWGLRPMANFFTDHVLNDIGKSLNYSSFSKMFRHGKPVPSKTVCIKVRNFVENDLPYRSVDDELDTESFTVLPFAKTRIETLVSSPTEEEAPSPLAKAGRYSNSSRRYTQSIQAFCLERSRRSVLDIGRSS